MANRTYLIQSASAAPSTYDSNKDILAASSYSIPVFWYALFEKGSIVPKLAKFKNGTAKPYPFLVTTTATAKARFEERRQFMRAVLPQDISVAFDDFARLLSAVEHSHLHLETVELWMMDAPEKFQRHVETCLRAFELPSLGVSPNLLRTTPEWRELLDQVQIDADDVAGTAEGYKLTGSSWIKPVPWQE